MEREANGGGILPSWTLVEYLVIYHMHWREIESMLYLCLQDRLMVESG